MRRVQLAVISSFVTRPSSQTNIHTERGCQLELTATTFRGFLSYWDVHDRATRLTVKPSEMSVD